MLTKYLVTFSSLIFPYSSAFAETAAAAWNEKISIHGDLRYRHEYASKLRQNSTSASHRERLRVRVGLTGEVNENIKIKLRLATSEGATPLATNQTMTDNASKKMVFFDMANVQWRPNNFANLVVGKQENPLRVLSQSQLVYDVDYTPEGISFSGDGAWITNFGAYVIQERGPSSTDGTSKPDSWLLAGVLGVKKDYTEGMGYTLAIGYHNFSAIKNNRALLPGSSGDFAGNSYYTNNSSTYYTNDYYVGEILGEVRWSWRGFKFSAYTDFIHNFYLENHNQGLLAGLSFSTLDELGKSNWTIAYSYTAQAKDSTVSALNNSDFAGGIDGSFGHTVTINKSLAPNTGAQLTLIHAEIDNNGNPFQSEKILADLLFAF